LISSVQWQYTKLALTPISDFFPSSKVVTMWQTDGTAYKLKPRLFHKSASLWVYSADFYPGVNCAWHYHTINVTFTEAKLFAIKCGINQATQIANINHIIVITNLIYATKRIFDSLVHSYQIQLSTILTELRKFFGKDQHNCIKF